MKKATLPHNFNQYNFKALAKTEKNSALKIRYMALSYLQTGKTILEAAQLVYRSSRMLHRWLQRLNEEGITGLRDKPGRGRKPHVPPEKEEELRQTVLNFIKMHNKDRVTGLDLQNILLNDYNIKCTIPTAYSTLARLKVS